MGLTSSFLSTLYDNNLNLSRVFVKYSKNIVPQWVWLM